MDRAMNAPEDLGNWPPLLRELAGIIGPERALALASGVGGISGVYVPTEADGDRHLWRRVLSHEEFRAVVAQWGGRRIDLPRGVHRRNTKQRIADMLDAGETSRAIALELGISDRSVRRHVRNMGLSTKLTKARQVSDIRALATWGRTIDDIARAASASVEYARAVLSEPPTKRERGKRAKLRSLVKAPLAAKSIAKRLGLELAFVEDVLDTKEGTHG